MIPKKIKRVDTVKFHDRPVGTLSLSPDGRLCVFEYDRQWLAEGFSISPLELPLRQGSFIAKGAPFNGAFGIFEDSLPDGYGRYLLKKALDKKGIRDADLTSLDRLSLVGSGGMGALTYHPETLRPDMPEIDDFDRLQEMALEVLEEKQADNAELLLFNSGNSGGARPKAVFSDAEGHWLVKFRHSYDSKTIGEEELRFNRLARQCGISVPDFKLVNGKYFASKRFDIDNDGTHHHTATAGGLMSGAYRWPCRCWTTAISWP